MTIFEPHGFYREYIDALNTRSLSDLDRFVQDTVIRNGRPSTRAETVTDIATHIDAVPDFHWRIVDIAAEGEVIAVRLTATGTPVKTWFGLEPTGASVEYMELAFYKVRDGRFTEMNWAMDVLEIQRQLSGRP